MSLFVGYASQWALQQFYLRCWSFLTHSDFFRRNESPKKMLEDVMVRRLEDDLRGKSVADSQREVLKKIIEGLPENVPNSAWHLYWTNIGARVSCGWSGKRGGRSLRRGCSLWLQQRLLSSVEAFSENAVRSSAHQ